MEQVLSRPQIDSRQSTLQVGEQPKSPLNLEKYKPQVTDLFKPVEDWQREVIPTKNLTLARLNRGLHEELAEFSEAIVSIDGSEKSKADAAEELADIAIRAAGAHAILRPGVSFGEAIAEKINIMVNHKYPAEKIKKYTDHGLSFDQALARCKGEFELIKPTIGKQPTTLAGFKNSLSKPSDLFKPAEKWQREVIPLNELTLARLNRGMHEELAEYSEAVVLVNGSDKSRADAAEELADIAIRAAGAHAILRPGVSFGEAIAEKINIMVNHKYPAEKIKKCMKDGTSIDEAMAQCKAEYQPIKAVAKEPKIYPEENQSVQQRVAQLKSKGMTTDQALRTIRGETEKAHTSQEAEQQPITMHKNAPISIDSIRKTVPIAA